MPCAQVSRTLLRPFESPLIYHVRPILQHGRSLLTVFRLVVDRTDTTLLVSKTLLDPVRVVAGLVQ